MPSVLDTPAIEGSTFFVDAAFTDEDGIAVVPSSLTWSLLDRAGTVLNGRSGETIPPAASVTIVLSGDDLALDNTAEGNIRFVLLAGTYQSDLAPDPLPLKDTVQFEISNLAGVV